jgi:hypothetical protein
LPIFRSIDKAARLGRDVARILKDRLAAASFDWAEFTGHSPRPCVCGAAVFPAADQGGGLRRSAPTIAPFRSTAAGRALRRARAYRAEGRVAAAHKRLAREQD